MPAPMLAFAVEALGLHRVVGRTEARNAGSARVLPSSTASGARGRLGKLAAMGDLAATGFVPAPFRES